MKTKYLVISSLLLAGLSFSPALFAGGGNGNGRGQCLYGSPDNCPLAQAGDCTGPQMRGRGAGYRGADNPNRQPKRDGTGGPQQNPNRMPKKDGTGGPNKPANPDCPQDGTGPGPRA